MIPTMRPLASNGAVETKDAPPAHEDYYLRAHRAMERDAHKARLPLTNVRPDAAHERPRAYGTFVTRHICGATAACLGC